MAGRIGLLILSVAIWMSISPGLMGREVIDKSTCQLKGHRLYGKIQLVESFPDITVEVVTAGDIKVEFVDSFPGIAR